MGIKTQLLIAVVLAAGLAPSPEAQARDHMSQVDLKAEDPSVGTVNADVDGTTSVVGIVGAPFKVKIVYRIGWSTFPSGGGTEISHQSDISDPEYQWFVDSAPPGLRLDGAFIHGTPVQAGQWKIWPAARDRSKSPYRGNGFWWTTFREDGGKTWSQAKDPTPIVVIPAPSGKEFRLQCTFQGSGDRHILEVDYDARLVKLIGNNGKLAGVYNVSVDPDLVGWNKMMLPTAGGAFDVANSSLDRKTGVWTVRTSHGGKTMTANCEKRAETQKF